ncbi:DUF4355 domain-containing protein [Bacillus sp. FSL W7-1360]
MNESQVVNENETVDKSEEEQVNEELQKKIEAESDRKLEKALEKKKKEWQKQMEEKVKEARKDAEEYAKLTEREKQEADYKKRLEELEAKERQLNEQQLLTQIEADLKEHQLPSVFAPALLSIGDNEKIKESIVDIKQHFDDAVNERVKAKLRQDTPSASVGQQQQSKHNFAELRNKAEKQQNQAPNPWAE